MAFIDGAIITKRHNGAPGGVQLLPNTSLQQSAAARTSSVKDCRRAQSRRQPVPHTVGPWKLKLRWPVDVSTLGSSTSLMCAKVLFWLRSFCFRFGAARRKQLRGPRRGSADLLAKYTCRRYNTVYL